MPFASYRTAVDVPAATLWDMLRDKIRSPENYVPGVVAVDIIDEFGPDSIERVMTIRDALGEKRVREIITADPATRTVMFKLKDDAAHTGYVLNIIFEDGGGVELMYTLHWMPKGESAPWTGPDMEKAIRNAVLHTKALAESNAT